MVETGTEQDGDRQRRRAEAGDVLRIMVEHQELRYQGQPERFFADLKRHNIDLHEAGRIALLGIQYDIYHSEVHRTLQQNGAKEGGRAWYMCSGVDMSSVIRGVNPGVTYMSYACDGLTIEAIQRGLRNWDGLYEDAACSQYLGEKYRNGYIVGNVMQPNNIALLLLTELKAFGVDRESIQVEQVDKDIIKVEFEAHHHRGSDASTYTFYFENRLLDDPRKLSDVHSEFIAGGVDCIYLKASDLLLDELPMYVPEAINAYVPSNGFLVIDPYYFSAQKQLGRYEVCRALEEREISFEALHPRLDLSYGSPVFQGVDWYQTLDDEDILEVNPRLRMLEKEGKTNLAEDWQLYYGWQQHVYQVNTEAKSEVNAYDSLFGADDFDLGSLLRDQKKS